MARAPISIGIASDAKQFLNGIKNDVIEPLKDAADTFDDVAKAGDRAADNLENGFKDQQRDTKALRKEYDKLGDDIVAASRKGRTSMVNDSDASTSRGKQNIRELSDEAKANLAETLSSFDGTVEGTISGIQGTLGGVTAGLTGVVPIIAAAAGAAGLGLLAVAWQTQSEAAEKVRAKVGELAAELIETGGIGQRSIDGMVESLKALAVESETGEKNLSDIAKTAKDAGLEFSKIAKAYVGNSDALRDLIKEQETYKDQLDEEASNLDTTTKAGNERYGQLQRQAGAIDRLNGTLRSNLDVTEKAEQAERDYLASGAPEIERKAALIGTINDAYDEAAGSTQDFINKESGLFDVNKYVKSMQAREQALLTYQDTLTKSALSPSAKSFLNEQGVETAALMLAGYKSASPKTKAELERIWNNAGAENSGTYANAFKKALPKSTTFPVTPKVDKNAIQRELNKQNFSITIGAPRLGKKAV